MWHAFAFSSLDLSTGQSTNSFDAMPYTTEHVRDNNSTVLSRSVWGFSVSLIFLIYFSSVSDRYPYFNRLFRWQLMACQGRHLRMPQQRRLQPLLLLRRKQNTAVTQAAATATAPKAMNAPSPPGLEGMHFPVVKKKTLKNKIQVDATYDQDWLKQKCQDCCAFECEYPSILKRDSHPFLPMQRSQSTSVESVNSFPQQGLE